MPPDTCQGVRQNGFAIKAIRELQGLSRTELAERLGTQRKRLADIEYEHQNAAPVLLSKIARVLGVSKQAIVRHYIADEASGSEAA